MIKIKLYHYSNTDIKDKIKVSYYGLNYFTFNDSQITTVKRAFYYTKPEPEHLLSNARFLYIVEIEPEALYNITRDIKGYLKSQSIDRALRQIRRIYKGVIYKIGNKEIVNLFYDVNFIKREVLR